MRNSLWELSFRSQGAQTRSRLSRRPHLLPPHGHEADANCRCRQGPDARRERGPRREVRPGRPLAGVRGGDREEDAWL